MKNSTLKALCILLTGILTFLASCKKQQTAYPIDKSNYQLSISRTQAISFLEQQINTARATPADSNTFLSNLQPDYQRLFPAKNGKGNCWNLYLKGTPIYRGQKLGYRKIRIYQNTDRQLCAELIEVLPDPTFLQHRPCITEQNFTGKIFRYGLDYKLRGGSVIVAGTTTGEILPGPIPHEKLQFNGLQTIQGSSPKDPLMLTMVSSCSWSQDWYIDADGDFTVHSTFSCSYSFFQEAMYSLQGDFGGGSGGYDYGFSGGGGSGGASSGPAVPATPDPSNLPMEDNKPVDPKEMMECFSAISTPNAAFVVRVLVIEPLAGTTFNVGPNSFGHVAIQLSKTGNGQTITQTMGLYPTGSGIAKLESRGQVLDNGDMRYDLAATYYVNNDAFSKLVGYLSGPRKDYNFTDFNCSSYVYQAGQAAGMDIPNPVTQVGISGPGGAGFADTPAGMAAALRAQRAANPKMDLNQGGGRIPPSKGPCIK